VLLGNVAMPAIARDVTKRGLSARLLWQNITCPFIAEQMLHCCNKTFCKRLAC